MRTRTVVLTGNRHSARHGLFPVNTTVLVLIALATGKAAEIRRQEAVADKEVQTDVANYTTFLQLLL